MCNMYSKKMNAILSAVLSCIILCSAPCISSLSPDYYAASCPHIQSMVKWGVWQAMQTDRRVAASLLRLHFHDCFVNGCDASVLLKDTKDFTGEQSAGPNLNSIRGFDAIDAIKADAERYCPSTVSCADILTLAASEAVIQSGGSSWSVSLGRLDGLTASKQSANDQLPSPLDSVDTIADKFAAKGLDMKDVVVLSGAHTLGFAQCFTFKYRLYNFNTTSKSDPSISPNFMSTLQRQCPNTAKSNSNLFPLDPPSTYKFDNSYYKGIMNRAGVLQSDQALMSDSRTVDMVRSYSFNPFLFPEDFGDSMVKLGSVGVITGGGEGEIRKSCGFVN